MSRLPLAGIRVVDFTWVGAGPFTTKILADFGAEVIKVESGTRPDQLRRAEPLVGKRGLDESGYFAVRNTNKKSVTIDMKQPGARDVVLALAAGADVMANSFSPRAMQRFGLSYRDVTAVNPTIVYLSMPMAGSTGPYKDYIGYGMSIAAIIGMFAMGGRPGRQPVGTGTNFPDHLPNPLHAAFAVLAALAHRERTGEGQEIMISQLESTLAAFPDAVLEFAANGRVQKVRMRRPGDPAPQGIYPCASADTGEERWCAISVADNQMFAALCRAMDQPALARDSRFADGAARVSNGPLLDSAIAHWTATLPAEAVVLRLQSAGVAASVVATPRDLLECDKQLAARGFWQRLDHPVMGRSVYHGIAAHFSRTPTEYRSPAPLLGQNNGELATLTGMSVEACEALAAADVIR